MAEHVSGVFAGYKRPHLTEIVLDQFERVGGDEFTDELVATTGPDPADSYVELLEETGLFDSILVQDADESAHEVWTRAHDQLEGPLYFYFQNDQYFSDPDVFDAAIAALDHVNFCRLERRPFTPTEEVPLADVEPDVGLYQGAYEFDHAAGLRDVQFPFTDEIDPDEEMMGERECAEAWQDSEYQTGLLLNDNSVRNLGMFSADGVPQYISNNNNILDRFFLPDDHFVADHTLPVDIESIIDEFAQVAATDEHVELFQQYITESYTPSKGLWSIRHVVRQYQDDLLPVPIAADTADTSDGTSFDVSEESPGEQLEALFPDIDSVQKRIQWDEFTMEEQQVFIEFASCLPVGEQ